MNLGYLMDRCLLKVLNIYLGLDLVYFVYFVKLKFILKIWLSSFKKLEN